MNKAFFHLHFPWLISLKDWLKAWMGVIMPVQTTYAQEGEDRHCANLLQGCAHKKGIYLDVGANHPCKISNTYLFYRKGLHGVTIEPDARMAKLHRMIRRDDIQLQIGCGKESGAYPFHLSKSSVFNSFSDNLKFDKDSVRYMPVLTVDSVMERIAPEELIFLYSLDVEGWDMQVLESSEKTLKRTVLLIVETDGGNDEIDTWLKARDFRLSHQTTYNSIYLNPMNFEKYLQSS